MKPIQRCIFSSLALVLLASCFVGPANAQENVWKFRLPFETHWGLASLHAGEYSFRLDSPARTGLMHLYCGKKAVALIMAQVYDQKAPERSELLITRTHGISVVREMRLRDAGLVFYYAEHRAEHGGAVDEREVGALIPMTASGAAQ
jgi:hypothetical protein